MKILVGKVISNRMPKTASVAVDRVIVHKKYKKRFKRTKKFHVHDEIGVEVGQIVKFAPSRPYSKLKKWKIVGVVKKERSEIESKNRKTNIIDKNKNYKKKGRNK